MKNVVYEVNPVPSRGDAAFRPALAQSGEEFCKRAFAAKSLDMLYYLLTNDIRILIEFDRCFLVTHMGGRSLLAAINNQPTLDKRAKMFGEMTLLARRLNALKSGVFLPNPKQVDTKLEAAMDDDILDALRSYMAVSESSYILVVPLNCNELIVGHIIFEFLGAAPPQRPTMEGVIRLAPFLGAALTEQWLFKKKPWLRSLLSTGSRTGSYAVRKTRLAVAVAVAAILFIVLVFFVPISDTVGGSAEVVQRQKHVAFSKIEGLIERVLVKEGDTVAEGDVLAALEPKEIDFKIQKAKTDFEVLTEELLLMRAVADQESQKLAESKLVELKRKAAWLDMNFYKWQSEFLEIKAPVSGVIATKDVQSLAGKKLTPGEAFCEIVVPTELWAEVSVPEDRVANVRPKQPLWLYLNNDPLESHSLIVEEISPASEANDRRGNLFRVKGPFPAGERTAKVGMKGTGKIDTGDKTLWFLVTRRLVKVWNEFALRFY